MESIAGCPADWSCLSLLHKVGWTLRVNLQEHLSRIVFFNHHLFTFESAKKILASLIQHVKDMVVVPSFKAHNGDNYFLGFNLLQVGLGEHANTTCIPWLGEDDGIAAKAHRSRFEPITVNPNWLFPLQSSLVAVAKAKVGKCKYNSVKITELHTAMKKQIINLM